MVIEAIRELPFEGKKQVIAPVLTSIPSGVCLAMLPAGTGALLRVFLGAGLTLRERVLPSLVEGKTPATPSHLRDPSDQYASG